MKHYLLSTLALALSAVPAFTQVEDLILHYIYKEATRQIEKQFQPDSVAAPVDTAGWDDYYRTSDPAGDGRARPRASQQPPDGVRIGCICMDGTRSDERGRGACGGRGGVRYWLYQVGEDSVVQFATDRHRAHPEPLSERERNNLSAYATSPDDRKPPGRNGSAGLNEVLITLMICVTIAYVARLWFDKGIA